MTLDIIICRYKYRGNVFVLTKIFKIDKINFLLRKTMLNCYSKICKLKVIGLTQPCLAMSAQNEEKTFDNFFIAFKRSKHLICSSGCCIS